MRAQEIYEFLNSFAPFNTALEFDNPGLLVGDPKTEVKTVLISLDCTIKAIEKAKQIGAELILTHHPVIYEPLKEVVAGTPVFECAKNGITVISAHTNLDFCAGGVCDTLCVKAGLKSVTATADGLRIGTVASCAVETFAENVGKALNYNPRFVEGKNLVQKVAICSGSGSSFLEQAVSLGCDTLLTGDVKYSAFITASNLGVNLIDAGHFETEQIILPVLEEKLKQAFPSLVPEIFNCNPVKTTKNHKRVKGGALVG